MAALLHTTSGGGRNRPQGGLFNFPNFGRNFENQCSNGAKCLMLLQYLTGWAMDPMPPPPPLPTPLLQTALNDTLTGQYVAVCDMTRREINII